MPRRMDLHAQKKLRGRARHDRAFFAAMDALDVRTPNLPTAFTALGTLIAEYNHDAAILNKRSE